MEVKVALYKCYLERLDHAPTLQTIECNHDRDAITQATTLLDTKPEHWGVEIWKEDRLLARVSRSRQPDQ